MYQFAEITLYILFGILFIAAIVMGTIGDYIIDKFYYDWKDKEHERRNDEQ